MSTTSGKGRLLPGSPADRVQRGNLTEFRGTLWDAVNDWFFGYNSVDMDWSDPADSAKFRRWVYTAADSIDNQVTITPSAHTAAIAAVSGTVDGLSNERDLFVIDETATWGVAHAQCEIIGSSFYTGNTLDQPVIKPQHGIGLRAQEDTRRRTVIAWHDIAIGLPQAINLGIWSGELDGSNFANRQCNLGMDLDETYTITAASRTEDTAAGFVFDGTTSSNWSTPDTAALDLVGDLTLEADFTLSAFPPATTQNLVGKFASGHRSYNLRLNTSGRPVFSYALTGAGGTALSLTASATPTPTAGRVAIRATFDADNGASGRTVTFYEAPTLDGTFVQLGTPQTTAVVAVLHSGVSALEVGAAGVGTEDRMTGRVHRAVVRTGINGAIVADARARDHGDAASTFTDYTGLTWTKLGTAVLANAGTGTATIGTHALRVADRVAVVAGQELSITGLQRTGGSACQCTLPGGHTLASGSMVRLLFCSDTSFNATVFVTVSGNTATWTHAGANNTGQTGILWDATYKLETAPITAVGATTITYKAAGATNATIPTTANSLVRREFPYFMEMKLEGTVASVRCWGRHQSVPSWMSETNALISDLTKASQVYTVTAAARVSGVVTATIGAHDLIVGERINLTVMTDSTFNQTSAIVQSVTATEFTYNDAGSDASGVTGTATRVGSGSAATVISNPCPVGSGRVAFAGAHIGTNDQSLCVYGPFFGDNDPDSQVLAISPDQATNRIQGAFSFPQVTAGVVGTPATATPAVLASSITLPAAAESVGAAPVAIAGPLTFPAAVESVGAAPAALSALVALPQATPVTAGNVTAVPAVLAGTFGLAQALSLTGATVSPAALAAVTAFAQVAESVGAGPLVVARSFVLPQATPVTAGNATVLPAVLVGGFALGQVVENVGAGPLVIARSLVLPQAVATAPALAAPAVLARSFVLPAAVVVIAAQATPAALTVLAVLARPGVNVGVSPALLARVFAFTAPGSGSFPPDPNPVLVAFDAGRNGQVTFTSRTGGVGLTEPQ